MNSAKRTTPSASNNTTTKSRFKLPTLISFTSKSKKSPPKQSSSNAAALTSSSSSTSRVPLPASTPSSHRQRVDSNSTCAQSLRRFSYKSGTSTRESASTEGPITPKDDTRASYQQNMMALADGQEVSSPPALPPLYGEKGKARMGRIEIRLPEERNGPLRPIRPSTSVDPSSPISPLYSQSPTLLHRTGSASTNILRPRPALGPHMTSPTVSRPMAPGIIRSMSASAAPTTPSRASPSYHHPKGSTSSKASTITPQSDAQQQQSQTKSYSLPFQRLRYKSSKSTLNTSPTNARDTPTSLSPASTTPSPPSSASHPRPPQRPPRPPSDTLPFPTSPSSPSSTRPKLARSPRPGTTPTSTPSSSTTRIHARPTPLTHLQLSHKSSQVSTVSNVTAASASTAATSLWPSTSLSSLVEEHQRRVGPTKGKEKDDALPMTPNTPSFNDAMVTVAGKRASVYDFPSLMEESFAFEVDGGLAQDQGQDQDNVSSRLQERERERLTSLGTLNQSIEDLRELAGFELGILSGNRDALVEEGMAFASMSGSAGLGSSAAEGREGSGSQKGKPTPGKPNKLLKPIPLGAARPDSTTIPGIGFSPRSSSLSGLSFTSSKGGARPDSTTLGTTFRSSVRPDSTTVPRTLMPSISNPVPMSTSPRSGTKPLAIGIGAKSKAAIHAHISQSPPKSSMLSSSPTSSAATSTPSTPRANAYRYMSKETPPVPPLPLSPRMGSGLSPVLPSSPSSPTTLHTPTQNTGKEKEKERRWLFDFGRGSFGSIGRDGKEKEKEQKETEKEEKKAWRSPSISSLPGRWSLSSHGHGSSNGHGSAHGHGQVHAAVESKPDVPLVQHIIPPAELNARNAEWEKDELESPSTSKLTTTTTTPTSPSKAPQTPTTPSSTVGVSLSQALASKPDELDRFETSLRPAPVRRRMTKGKERGLSPVPQSPTNATSGDGAATPVSPVASASASTSSGSALTAARQRAQSNPAPPAKEVGPLESFFEPIGCESLDELNDIDDVDIDFLSYYTPSPGPTSSFPFSRARSESTSTPTPTTPTTPTTTTTVTPVPTPAQLQTRRRRARASFLNNNSSTPSPTISLSLSTTSVLTATSTTSTATATPNGPFSLSPVETPTPTRSLSPLSHSSGSGSTQRGGGRGGYGVVGDRASFVGLLDVAMMSSGNNIYGVDVSGVPEEGRDSFLEFGRGSFESHNGDVDTRASFGSFVQM